MTQPGFGDSRNSKGSLIVVGSGIAAGQMTVETRRWIEVSDKVLHCVADPVTERLIDKLNPNTETLKVFYAEGKPRRRTYVEMTNRILECVREGQSVCVIYYGHPGIFVDSTHAAMKIASDEGYPAKMLPAISALDCLFADLGVDPAAGCQMFEATDLLLRRKKLDVQAHVILWQVGATGDLGFTYRAKQSKCIPILVEYLLEFYQPDHTVTIYEAAQYPVCQPVIEQIEIGRLHEGPVSGISTVYVPPMVKAPTYLSMVRKLGLYDMVSKGFKFKPKSN